MALGTFCLIGGREGVGKSLLAYTLAAQLTQGLLPGQYFHTPRSVVVAAAEDSWEHTIVPRLMAAGADLAQVFRIDVITPTGDSSMLSLPTDIGELHRVVTESSAALILLDPLLSRVAADLDTHKDSEVRLALEPLATVADRTGATVLGLIHVNKSQSTDALTMLMGSRAFVAVARSVLFVLTDPEDATKRLMGQAKNNLGRMDLASLAFHITGVKVADAPEGEIWTAHLQWLGNAASSLHDAILASALRPQDQPAVDEAALWLTDYLTATGGPADSAKIKRAGQRAGHTIMTLQRARAKIHAVVSSVGFPRQTFWALETTAPVVSTLHETTGDSEVF